MHRWWTKFVFASCFVALPGLIGGANVACAQDKAEIEAKVRAAAEVAAKKAQIDAELSKVTQIKGEEEAKPDKPADPNAKPEEKPAEEPATETKPAEAPNPKIVQLFLLDGTVITGEMEIEEITVSTEFGDLKIPLTKVRSLMPGLSSSPELSSKVNGMIDALGSDDYKAREQAHKDLAGFGLKVKNLLDAKRNDENAERKRHVGEILKELEELASEQEALAESGAAIDAPWIAKDTVVTGEFTVVGKVSPAEFTVASKYGPLKVQLAHLRRAERPTTAKESTRKLVNVPGDNLAQRSFKNSGIKVEAGDRISIKADGSVVMSPWGSDQSSGPDGAPNYGWYVPNQIYGGALVAKIGDKGTVFKVGSKSTFVAKTSGTLQFAVAMQQQYAQQGYSYPGQYNVRVTVEPK